MPRLLHLGLLLVFGALSAKIWIHPLLMVPREHRGDYLYGLIHLVDLYRGIPIALVTLALVLTAIAPARHRKAIGHRAAAVLLGVFVPFYAVDLTWSLLWVGAAKPAYWLDEAHISRLQNEPDDELGFRRKANIKWEGAPGDVEAAIHYRTDANGFHNPPDVADQVDIVFIGDSYTEAAQVDEDDCFARRIGAELGRSVVNLGRGAYGPPQERIVLEKFGMAYQPDVVVWQVFEGNDLGDAEKFDAWAADKSIVASSLEQRYVNNSLVKPLFAATARVKNRVWLTRVGDDARFRLRYRFDPTYPETKAAGLSSTLDSLRSGAALCQANGARLVVLYLPIMLRVYGPYIDFEDPNTRDRCYPAVEEGRKGWADAVAAVCAELDAEFVDLYPVFRAHADTDPSDLLYIPTDEHLTMSGHQVVTKALTKALTRD